MQLNKILLFLIVILFTGCKKDISYSEISKDLRLEIANSEKLNIIVFHEDKYKDYGDFEFSNLFKKSDYYKDKNYQVTFLEKKKHIDWYYLYRNAMYSLKRMPQTDKYLAAVVTKGMKPLFVSDVWSADILNKVLPKILDMQRSKENLLLKQADDFTEKLIRFPRQKIEKTKFDSNIFYNTYAALLTKKSVDITPKDILFLNRFNISIDEGDYVKKSRQKVVDFFREDKTNPSLSYLIALEDSFLRYKDTILKRKLFKYMSMYSAKDEFESAYYNYWYYKYGKVTDLTDVDKVSKNFTPTFFSNKSPEFFNHWIDLLLKTYQVSGEQEYLLRAKFAFLYVHNKFFNTENFGVTQDNEVWTPLPYFFDKTKDKFLNKEALFLWNYSRLKRVLTDASSKRLIIDDRMKDLRTILYIRHSIHPMETMSTGIVLISDFFLSKKNDFIIGDKSKERFLKLQRKAYSPFSFVLYSARISGLNKNKNGSVYLECSSSDKCKEEQDFETLLKKNFYFEKLSLRKD